MLTSRYASSSKHGLTNQICNYKGEGLSQETLSCSGSYELSGNLCKLKVYCQV